MTEENHPDQGETNQPDIEQQQNPEEQPWNQETPQDSPPVPASGGNPTPRPGESSGLPDSGDESEFEEEPVDHENQPQPADADMGEERDEPNDLSHIEKEFEGE